MHWIAPSEKDAASDALEKQLWDAADNFRANSGLTAQQYSGPILGLIFLRFAEARFAVRRTALDKSAAKGGNAQHGNTIACQFLHELGPQAPAAQYGANWAAAGYQ